MSERNGYNLEYEQEDHRIKSKLIKDGGNQS